MDQFFQYSRMEIIHFVIVNTLSFFYISNVVFSLIMFSLHFVPYQYAQLHLHRY